MVRLQSGGWRWGRRCVRLFVGGFGACLAGGVHQYADGVHAHRHDTHVSDIHFAQLSMSFGLRLFAMRVQRGIDNAPAIGLLGRFLPLGPGHGFGSFRSHGRDWVAILFDVSEGIGALCVSH